MQENRIRIDGNCNIILQDIDNSSITIQNNDTKQILEYIEKFKNSIIDELSSNLKSDYKSVVSFFERLYNLKERTSYINHSFKAERVNTIENKIVLLYQLLSDWELKYDLAENPTEKLRCDFEIKQIKVRLNNYETEISEMIKKNT